MTPHNASLRIWRYLHPAAAPPPEVKLPEELARLRARMAKLKEDSRRIGQLPPRPPTLRGAVGAFLTSIVRRMLFWYTPEIQTVFDGYSEVLEDLYARLATETEVNRQLTLREAQVRQGVDELMDALGRELLEAYGCLNGAEAAAYVGTHYTRYQTTLDFIGAAEGPLRILELGASPPYAFTVLLAHRFPEADISLAYHTVPPDCVDGRIAIRSSQPDKFPSLSFPVHAFNAESEIWPFDSQSFDLVLCMEMMEHLLLDPCFLFRECHRVLSSHTRTTDRRGSDSDSGEDAAAPCALKPGGRFIVTTPNIASMEGVLLTLLNQAPYRFGPYSPYGQYGRHNREFVPHELRLVGECSGFATEKLATYDVYPIRADLEIARKALEALNDDLSLRNQNIFYEGRKTDAPFQGYPRTLYDYDIPEYSAVLRKLQGDGHTVRVEATNTGRREWSTGFCLGARLPDGREFLRILLERAVQPGGSVVVEFAAGVFSKASPAGMLKLDMADAEGRWFSDSREGGPVDAPALKPRPLIIDCS